MIIRHVIVVGAAVGQILAAPAVSGLRSTSESEPVVWRFEQLRSPDRPATKVLGAPREVTENGRRSLQFNGKSDGLIMADNPIQGCSAFTVEVLFKPDADGPPAQRFVHLEDTRLNRALIETRVTESGAWYLDTYLYANPPGRGLTLVDKGRLHPGDRWYWAALVYDGSLMAHFVNGRKEREGAIEFGPMAEGRTSVGVRLNEVFWFKGNIAEVRFHPRALGAAQLQRETGR